MRKLLIILLSALSLTAVAQQTIALLPSRIGEGSTAVTTLEKNMVRGELRKAIVNFAGYDAITRTDIDQMMQEQNFQRTGLVNEAQIKKLGEISGADYLCVSTITKSNTEFYIEAYLVHVESGRMLSPASQYGELTNGKLANMFPACQALAKELLGDKSVETLPHQRSQANIKSKNHEYTEDAWDINMKMIWVEGGEFMMGCTSELGGECTNDEQTLRRTFVDGFYIGEIEVTQSQWEKVMGTTIYKLWDRWNYQEYSRYNILQYYQPNTQPSRGIGSNYPIYCVTWEEAMEFCQKLSQKTGKIYTLPTEAQWEFAARGGNNPDGTRYAGSNVIDAVAWYEDNSNHETHPCGTKRPNSIGLYDMSGNVGEWCKDWYEDTYRVSDSNNPTGAPYGDLRVNRGGGWGIYASNCRVTHRDADDPYMRHRNLGFRVVCIP